jgi:hypothetical protein
MEWIEVMKKVILALVSLFLSEQSMAATSAVDNKNHQSLTHTQKARPKSQAKTATKAVLPASTTANHNTPVKKTKTPQAAEKCPKNCHEAGVMLQHIHDLRVKIEDKQASLNPHYQKKKINPVNIAQFKGTCEKSCPQLTGIQRQVDKYEKDLATLNSKAGPTAKATPNKAITPQAGDKCPKNCHEAGAMLQHIHDLRVQIEDKQASLDPKYQKKKINPVNIAQFKGTCDTSCPQITGIQRQVDKYEKDLAALNGKAGPAGKMAQPQATTPQAGDKCPKNCFDLGEKLEAVYKLQVEIENEHKRQNSSYQKKSIRPVDIRRFIGTCDTSCPQIIQAEKQVQRFEKELADLKAKQQNAAASQPEGVQEESHQAASATPTQPQRLKGQCTPNCDNEVDLRINIRQMNIELDQLKLAQDPTFKARTYEKEINPSIKIGKQCSVGCNNIKLLETRKAQLETEIAKVKANSSPTATQPQRLKGQCTPNCDNEVDLRINIRQMNIELDQLKLAQDPTFKVRTYEKEINPSIKIGKQCPVGCNNIKLLETRKAQLETEITKVKANSNPNASQAGSVKGQCTPNCDNEVDLRTDIRQLNTQVEELKHQHDPSYRMKPFKDIDQSIKIGKQCPVGCNNIKRLEKRKTELETMIATLEKTATSSPVEEETEPTEPTGPTTTEPVEENTDTEAPMPDLAEETPVGESLEEATDEASEEPASAVAPQKKRSLFHRVTSTVTKHAVRAASTVRDAFLARPKKTDNSYSTSETYGAGTEEQETDTLATDTPSMDNTAGEEPVEDQESESSATAPAEPSDDAVTNGEPLQAENADQTFDSVDSNTVPEDAAVNTQEGGTEELFASPQPSEETGISEAPSQTDMPAAESDTLDSSMLAGEEAANEQNTNTKGSLLSQPSVEELATEEPTADNAANPANSLSKAPQTNLDNPGDDALADSSNQYEDEDNGESSISTDETTDYSSTPLYGNGGSDGGEIFHSDSDDNNNGNALGATAMATMGNIFNGLLAQQQPSAPQQPVAQNTPLPRMAAPTLQDTDNSQNDYGATSENSNSALDQTDGSDGLNSAYGDGGSYGDLADTSDTNDGSSYAGNDPYGSNADASY